MMQPSCAPCVRAGHNWTLFALIFILLIAVGCGGSGDSSGTGGGGGGGGTNPSEYSLSVTPSAAAVFPGDSLALSVAVSLKVGTVGTVSVQISGLPAGVTASPSTITASPSSPANVTLSVASGTPAASANISFTGTPQASPATSTLSLSIVQPATGAFSTRSKYVRTDAVTEYFQWPNSHWVVYHAPTARFFVTDPVSNQVFVFDATTRTKIASIIVPGAFGIDQTFDQSQIYAGSLLGDIHVIDPVTMTIKQHYQPDFLAGTALPLANGSVALLAPPSGIPGVDGSNSIAIWNPNNGPLVTIYGGFTGTPLCGVTINAAIFSFVLTSDRQNVISNAGTNLCELNPVTGQMISVPAGGNQAVLVSPDGKYVAIAYAPDTIQLLDQKSLQNVSQLKVSTDNFNTSGFLFSGDGGTLYVAGTAFVNAYNVSKGQLLGWVPNIYVSPTTGGLAGGPTYTPIYQAADSTGLLAGPLEEGVALLDAGHLRTGPLARGLLNGYLNPATGPATGGTVTETSIVPPSAILFGPNQAAFEAGTGDLISITTPPGTPGPVDVYLFAADGGLQILPDSFSYGPSLLEVAPNVSTAEGGGTGVIYGYGFGPGSLSTVIPPELSVTVGGQPAQITAFNPNSYNIQSPPFPLQSIYYTIPSGTSGQPVDVTVTSASGSATAKAAMTFIPALKSYPLQGAALVQGVYDPVRDLYYFTDTNKIQVFSLRQGVWQTPIPLPVPAGTSQRLWGLGLSPDSSKLAVADASAGVVYFLDPGNPTSVQTFPFNPQNSVQGIQFSPVGVAVDNSGMIWLTAEVLGGTGFHNYFKLDSSSGTLTDLDMDGPDSGSAEMNLRTVIRADNGAVYFNNGGQIFYYEVSGGGSGHASVEPGCCYGDYELSVATNRTRVEASGYLYGGNLNAVATLALNDREALDVSYVYGNKLSPDGLMLFQPGTQGADVYDTNSGHLRSRIATATQLSTVYDALVSDGKDNVLIAITGASGNGIAVLDLSSLSTVTPLSATAQSDFLAASEHPQSDPSASEISGAMSAGRQKSFRQVPHVTGAVNFH
jgi:WD40 repeat protein